MLGVVAQEMRMHVHDELVFQRAGALLRHRRRGGFRLRHVKQRPIDFVHRDERCGHAGRGLEKPAAIETLLSAEIVGHRQQPRFDLALPFVLRVGIEFVARDDLRRDRRLVCAQFGRHQCGKFGFRQLVAHVFPPCRGRFRGRIDPATTGCQPILAVIARWCSCGAAHTCFQTIRPAVKLRQRKNMTRG
jgi:hypothetical protein